MMSPSRAPVIGVYPGSFDPPTLGHLDIARRAARLVDRLVIAIFATPSKSLVFTAEERAALWQASLRETVYPPNVEIMPFEGLTTEFARSVNATVLVRGLRTVTDFEVEFQQAHMYRRLAPEIDLMLLVTELPHMFVSASLVKEVARLGAPVDSFVTPTVERALREKFSSPPVS